MPVPTYSSDLIANLITNAASGFTEPTGALVGTLAPAETDFFIQGTNCTSKSIGNATGLAGAGFQSATARTIPSPGAFMVWIYFGAPNAIDTLANGGLQLIVGQNLSNYKRFFVGGSDTYTYGGWLCVPADPSLPTDGIAQGVPSGVDQYFGYIAKAIFGVSKGNPFGVDAIRFGRCFLMTEFGELGSYGTFAGAVALNDDPDNRLGLLQDVGGSYLQQGLFVMGSDTNAVDFRDSNRTINISNTTKVASAFNGFEVRNSASRVDWTNITIGALGTVSKGQFITTNNATVNLTSCTFVNMDTFGFLSNASVLSTIFRGCGLVTQGGALLSETRFERSTSPASLLSSNPTNVQGCTFVSDGSNHAIEINTPGTYSFDSNTFAGYAVTNGTTGNEAIYNNSGGAVTLNVTTAGTGIISIRNGTGATTTVASSASITVDIVDSEGAAITGNSEITIVRNSDIVILFEEDNVIDGSVTYSYNSGGGVVTYINILNVAGYQPKTVNNVTLPSSGSVTLTVQLDTDTFYSNPI